MPQFGHQIDTMRIPIKGLMAEQAATGSAPASPVEGLLWHDTTTKNLKIWLNGGWVQVDNQGVATGSGVSDGDKGDITVTGSGTIWTIDPGAVTSAKIADGTIALGDLAFTPITSGGAAGGDLTGTYPNPTIGPSKVTTSHILDGTILVADLSTSSVRLDTIGTPTGAVNLGNQKITNLADPTLATDAVTKQYADNAIQGLDAKQSVKLATTGPIGSPTSAAPSTIDGSSVNVGDRILVKDQASAAENGIYDVVTVGTGANGVWARSADLNVWSEAVSAYTWVEAGTVNSDTGWLSTGNQSGTIGTTPMPWVQFSGAGQIIDGIGLLKTGNTLDVRLDNTTIEAPSDILQVKDGGITSAKLATGAVDLTTTKVTGTLPVSKGGTNNAGAFTAGGIVYYTGTSGGTLLSSIAGTAGQVVLSGGASAPTFGASQILAGGGLTGGGTLAADRTLSIDTTVVVRKVASDLNAGSAIAAGTEYTITHNLGTLDVQVGFIRKTAPAAGAAAGAGIELGWRAVTTNTIGVTADVAFAANEIRVMVQG